MIDVGIHLVGFGTGVADWGDTEQREMVAKTGRDIIVRAWRRDKALLQQVDLILAGVFGKP